MTEAYANYCIIFIYFLLFPSKRNHYDVCKLNNNFHPCRFYFYVYSANIHFSQRLFRLRKRGKLCILIVFLHLLVHSPSCVSHHRSHFPLLNILNTSSVAGLLSSFCIQDSRWSVLQVKGLGAESPFFTADFNSWSALHSVILTIQKRPAVCQPGVKPVRL